MGGSSGVGRTMRLVCVALALALAGCAPLEALTGQRTNPVWAAQLAWAPVWGALSIDYNSANPAAPVDGAYQGTGPVFPVAGWRAHTWRLTAASLAGRQNFGADLRLAGSPGVAVSEVVLSLRPPGRGGPEAEIRLGAAAATGGGTGNLDQGLRQVGAGGRQGDSFYHDAILEGRPAEVLDAVNGPASTSYIYLRLDSASPVLAAHPSVLYATVTYTTLHPATAWSERTFAKLAARGVRAAEINLEWGALEPEPGQFDFRFLDEDLANAARAGVKVIPIFWYSVWPGNPAPWITSFDQGSGGTRAQVPAWWDPANRQAYFTYVQRTVAHIKKAQAFGGTFLDYGWLDDMWGPAPGGSGVNGYAPTDIARFHQWLPTQYGSLAAFNGQHQTSYSSWSQVPAAKPGEPLFPVYQAFREWSVGETYARMSQIYRRETSAPLYYYFGGGMGGAGVAFNVPDTFFAVARRYHAVVMLDDADRTGLALLFHSLAQAYGVPLMEEWSPGPSGLRADSARFLGHVGLEGPRPAGMDFFLYDGGREYRVGYPQYTRWIPLLSRIRGDYPRQPVALYLSYADIRQDPQALAGMTGRIETIWRQNPQAFAVVTDREIAAGVARLAQYRAVYPLSGAGDANLQAYARHGGQVLTSWAELTGYAPAYATLAPDAPLVEVVPTVDAATRSAWITVAGVNPTWSYHGTITLHLAGLGLPAGPYHVVDAGDARDIPAQPVPGGLSLNVHIIPGSLALWHLVPGAGPVPPSGGATSTHTTPTTGPQTLTFTAGAENADLRVLNITPAGQAATGDGNVSLVRERGRSAVATWTTQQLGTPGAYMYLAVNPTSRLYAAASLELAVTYLATPGQSFQVQYGGTDGPYTSGPTVTSPGGGLWVTARVLLEGVRLDAGENGQADLRLSVWDGQAPLVVRSLSLSAPAGG